MTFGCRLIGSCRLNVFMLSSGSELAGDILFFLFKLFTSNCTHRFDSVIQIFLRGGNNLIGFANLQWVEPDSASCWITLNWSIHPSMYFLLHTFYYCYPFMTTAFTWSSPFYLKMWLPGIGSKDTHSVQQNQDASVMGFEGIGTGSGRNKQPVWKWSNVIKRGFCFASKKYFKHL